MQSDLARVGIDARIVSYENSFRRRLSRGEHDTALIGGMRIMPSRIISSVRCSVTPPLPLVTALTGVIPV